MTTRLTVRGIIYNPQTDSVFVQKLKKLQGNNWYLPYQAEKLRIKNLLFRH